MTFPVVRYLTTVNNNPGDKFADAGSRSIMMDIFPRHNQTEQIINVRQSCELGGHPYKLRLLKPDIVALTDTVWFWDGGHISEKYTMLQEVFDEAPDAVKIAFGIGSCFLDYDDVFSFATMIERNARECAPLWQQFDLIFCRDPLIYKAFLPYMGAERLHLAACPSFYSAKEYDVPPTSGETGRTIMGFTDPDRLFIKDYLSPEMRQYMLDIQVQLMESGDVEVVTFGEPDRDGFMQRFGRHVPYVCETRDILHVLSHFDRCYSGRVHTCIPARSLGLDSFLFPIDSRALTAYMVGVQKWGDWRYQLSELNTDYTVDRQRIVELAMATITHKRPDLFGEGAGKLFGDMSFLERQPVVESV